MAENSDIAWTHHTFNPWMGCTKISPACVHCYAEKQVFRFTKKETKIEDVWGVDAPRQRTGRKYWAKPHAWNRKAAEAGTRHRVFVASLADVFDNHRSIKKEWRDALWQLIRECPHLDFLLLTKRPQNMRKMLPADWGNGYPNVWLGTTVENQEECNKRLQWLLDFPAVVHFVSCEPLLGPVDLRRSIYPPFKQKHENDPFVALDGLRGYMVGADEYLKHKIGWVICGGESAPNDVRRDMNLDWARSLRDQCAAAGVPFLFKQYSGPNQKAIKAQGRALDGVVHDDYPLVQQPQNTADGVPSPAQRLDGGAIDQ